MKEEFAIFFIWGVSSFTYLLTLNYKPHSILSAWKLKRKTQSLPL